MTSSKPGGVTGRPRSGAAAWDRLNLGLLVAGLIGLSAPMSVAAYTGSFSRYLADDFCTLGSLRQLGFFGSQAYWYVHWSGRFAFTFFVNLAEAAGPWVVPLLPAVTLLALAAGVGGSLEPWLTRRLGRIGHLTAWVVALLVVFETLAGAPNLYQSLYWQTGLLTYVAPLVLGCLYAAWLVSRLGDSNPGAGVLGLSAAAMLVAAAFSESVGSVLVAALAGSLLLVWLLIPKSSSRTAALRLLAAGLGGAVVGYAIMAAAPGNAVRQGLLTPSTDWANWGRETVRNAYVFSVRAFRSDPIRLLLAAAGPMLAVVALTPGGADSPAREPLSARRWAWLVALPAFTFILVMACMAPTQYAMSSYPDGRILIAAQFVIAAGMAVWGIEAGWMMRQARGWPAGGRARGAAVAAWGFAVLVIVFTSLGSAVELTAQIPDARDFAVRSDERLHKVSLARQQGVSLLPVASLTHMGGLDEINPDSSYWVNVCFAQAYGLHKVTAK